MSVRGLINGVLAGTFVFIVGCSSKSGSGALDMSTAGDGAEGGLVAREAGAAAYPVGPYGVGVGSVVGDASFYGYPRFDTLTLSQFALHDFYNPDGTKLTTTGAPVSSILFAVGAVWCNPCVQEAGALPTIANKFLPAGVQIIQDLFEGPDEASGTPATQDDLQAWITTHQLPFPVFIDPNKKMAPYFDVASLPFVMLLDAKTMTTLGEETGFGGEAALEAFICQHASVKPSVCP